jgi:hypothetical protein
VSCSSGGGGGLARDDAAAAAVVVVVVVVALAESAMWSSTGLPVMITSSPPPYGVLPGSWAAWATVVVGWGGVEPPPPTGGSRDGVRGRPRALLRGVVCSGCWAGPGLGPASSAEVAVVLRSSVLADTGVTNESLDVVACAETHSELG